MDPKLTLKGQAAVAACVNRVPFKEMAEAAIKAAVPQETVLTVKTLTGQRSVKGLSHSIVPDLVKLLSMRPEAALLSGPAGCGKTYMAGQAAELLGLDFFTINMSEGVTEGQLFGQRTLEPDGSTGWTDGIVTRAFENGGLLFIDEFDNSDPNVLVGLNQVADGSKVVSMAHRVHKPMAKRHEDFQLLCGANTLLQGGSAAYSSRNRMDMATVDRFLGAILKVDFDTDLERKLIQEPLALQVLWGFRKYLNDSGLTDDFNASTRLGIKLAKRAAAGHSLDTLVAQATILLTEDQQRDAAQVIAETTV